MANPFDAPKWGFIINPIDNLFQAFAERARSPDFYIWRRDPGFVTTEHVFGSAHFEWARDIGQLADIAVALKAVFDGAMFLDYGSSYIPPVFLRLLENRSGHTYDFPTGNVLAPPFSQLTLSSAVPSMFDSMVRFDTAQMVFLARYDDVTRAMLKHLGYNGPDFRTLYSLLDWLGLHGWKDHGKIAAAAGVGTGEVKRFTSTANNVEILGPHARHGDRNWRPPASPMNLEDAQHLVLSAVRAFLGERAVHVGLDRRWTFLDARDRRW